ncbi:hypothetical protein L873DRAFT_1795166 [Choiromyces venosus 120613-1]|uniref:Uncharacterized protein n=1 Tax=Choiromyces venosus 120613-1 TaxID=1336337 RepID=A0A3N4J350_9PEZI|nr:hypothetical protein L873DRAFT_1795166 [Choiromyces venosus 120613-1]
MLSAYPHFQYPYNISTTPATSPLLLSYDKFESSPTTEYLLTQVPYLAGPTLSMSGPSTSNTFDMNFSERNINLGDNFLDKIYLEDSVSQTFNYFATPPQPITLQPSNIMEIDEDIEDTTSSLLSAPSSLLLTRSIGIYSHVGDQGEPSIVVPDQDISQLPGAFLA